MQRNGAPARYGSVTVNDLNPRPPSELGARGLDLTANHFTPPWTVQELEACFVVIDSSGQKLAFVYHRDEPSQRAAKLPSKDQARQIATCQLDTTVTNRMWERLFKKNAGPKMFGTWSISHSFI
jgi:hypothetical protein